MMHFITISCCQGMCACVRACLCAHACMCARVCMCVRACPIDGHLVFTGEENAQISLSCLAVLRL